MMATAGSRPVETCLILAFFLTVLLGIVAAIPRAQSAAAVTPTPFPSPTSTPTVTGPEGDLGGIESTIIFPWMGKPGGLSANWLEGLLHFLLGVVGALVTVYLFLGDFLPSMGGKVEYEQAQAELRELKKRRDRSLSEREKYAKGEVNLPLARLEAEGGLTQDFDKAIERLEHQISRNRWRLFLLGFPLYLLLGGFFASAFALNALQAVLIGFSWTAVADRIGLQRELSVKGDLTEEAIDRLEEEGLDAEKELTRLRQENNALKTENATLRKVVEAAALAAKPTSGQR